MGRPKQECSVCRFCFQKLNLRFEYIHTFWCARINVIGRGKLLIFKGRPCFYTVVRALHLTSAQAGSNKIGGRDEIKSN